MSNQDRAREEAWEEMVKMEPELIGRPFTQLAFAFGHIMAWEQLGGEFSE